MTPAGESEAQFAAESLVNGIVGAGIGEVDIVQGVTGNAARFALAAPRTWRRPLPWSPGCAVESQSPGGCSRDSSLWICRDSGEISPPDEKTCLIRAQAGAVVRDVEARAIQAGMTLGALLPSTPRKTVGSWLAGPTRGERAVPPGRIETAALALEAVLADGGTYRSRETPRSATGPDLDHVILGGEGRFGIITRATLRLFPRALVESSAATPVGSPVEAVRILQEAARTDLAPAEARWDRARGMVEARFNGPGAAVRARRFGQLPVGGHEMIRGHLELAGSWGAWSTISPLRPQALQFVAFHTDGAFGAIQFEDASEAEAAAIHAQAMGFAIVSPRKLRPSPDVGWSRAGGLLSASARSADPHGVFRR